MIFAPAKVQGIVGGVQRATPQATPLDLDTPLHGETSRAITLRSLVIGSLLVCLVCGLTPYNDYVVGNSFLIGSYLPVFLVLAFFVLIVLVNAPLHRWRPRSALSTAELAVILLMTLVSSSIPGQGLMRSLLPTLVAPFYQSQANATLWSAFTSLGLPAWLFPVGPIDSGRESEVVNWFYARAPASESPPYLAWIGPLFVWMIFIGAMLTALISLATIFHRQWAVNERVPFPLAELQLQLIESPRPGHAFNDLFRSRGFWIAALLVIAIHSSTALNSYFPKTIPAVPMKYDLSDVLSEPPFSYLSRYVKSAQIYFVFIGVMYFVPAKIGASITACYMGMALFGVQQQWFFQREATQPMWEDQHLGAGIAWVTAVLWIGRRHFATVARHLFFGRRGDEPVSYRAPAIALVISLILMCGWLLLLGTSPTMTLIIVALVLLAHVIVARIVAETGLPIVRSVATPDQIYTLFAPAAFSGKDIYFAGVFHANGAYTTRESAMTFAMHGEQVTDRAMTPPPQRWKWMMIVAWTLVLSIVVSAGASLHAYYNHALPMNATALDNMINKHGADTLPRNTVSDPLVRHSRGNWMPSAHDSAAHIGIGAAIVTTMQLGAVRFAWWPLAPVGFVIATTPFLGWAWFSVMIGWLAKVLVVRLGGVQFYRAARPIFIGLIFGEALATGIWIVINLVLASLGMEFKPVRFLVI